MTETYDNCTNNTCLTIIIIIPIAIAALHALDVLLHELGDDGLPVVVLRAKLHGPPPVSIHYE